MVFECPGTANLRTPTIKIKKCPKCGAEVEIFSTDMKAKCDNCGTEVFDDLQSCIQWCQYAEKCLGDELYKKMKTN